MPVTTPPTTVATAAAPLPPPPLNVIAGVGSRVGMVHVSVFWLELNEQLFPAPLMFDDEYVKPNGIVSVSTTFVACDDDAVSTPALATVTLHVSGCGVAGF